MSPKMKSSQSPSKPAAAAKPPPHCAFPGCPEPASHQCSRCRETHYYSADHQKTHWKLHKKLCVAPQKKMSAPVPPPPPSSKVPPRTCGSPDCTKKGRYRCSKCDDIDYCSEKHQEAHWKYHKKICVVPQKKISAPVPSAPPLPLKGSVDEEEKYENKCVICLDNVRDAQMRPCGHSATCRDCTRELMTRSEPCPLCRKPISGFDVGVYSNSVGERGLWLTSARNIREFAKNDDFNEYFQKQFNWNEATFLRWKEVFDVLEIVGGRGCHCTVRENMEQQVLTITRSEDLVKLRALARLCSQEFFDDQSLLAVAWRRILEVLELAMPEEKKTRGKKKQKKKKDPRKLEILDACAALGRAVSFVGDMDDAIRYNKRAKDGYEEQLGRDSEKALDVTRGLIANTAMSRDKKIEKYRDLLKRCERALGEENVTTLSTLYSLGAELQKNGENEEAKGVFERCLAERTKVLGEDHKNTYAMANNLGTVYLSLKNYEKALELFERAYEGYEKTLGKSHPETLNTVMNRGGVSAHGGDFGTAEELFQTAFEGYDAQLGKDHDQTKASAENLATVQMLIKNQTKSDSSQIRSRIP